MPSKFNGEERYNFLLALVGFLRNRGPIDIEVAAEAFDVTPKYIREAVRSLLEATATVGGWEQWFFNIDLDELDEHGILALTENLVIDEVPRLSNRQASAIAAGLNYLSAIQTFANDDELKELQEMLADGSSRGINPLVELRPGSAEAGAEIIRRAIIDGKQISCEYFNQKGERANRKIHPLRLDPSTDGWYLRGFCPIHNELRNFKLDRMRSIEILEDMISEAARQIGEIDEKMYVAEETDTTVLVEVQPEAYRLISDFIAITEPISAEAGVIRAEIKIGHLPNIAKLIARYGGAAKVIAPKEARDLVKNYALRALGENLPSDEREDG